MSTKKEKHSKSDKNQVEEPSVAFKIYPSFQEMEEDELKWLAGLSPKEHLQHTTSLIQRMFSKQLEEHPKLGTRIYFDKSK
jgi:hypothetical protein